MPYDHELIAPRISQKKALRLATITLQMTKAMNCLYRGLSPREHRPNVQEFEMPLRLVSGMPN
jgi:hypothetical protein